MNEKDNEGETFLLFATRRDHTEIVELLNNAGAKERRFVDLNRWRFIHN